MSNEMVQTGVLRLFGMPTEEVTHILRSASRRGCPGLRLLARDGEFAVCIRASAATQAAADAACHQWIQQLSISLGSAVYGVGETDLAETTLKILLKEKRLIVAADHATGDILNSTLHPLQHSEAAYDFGNQSWGDEGLARRIEVPAGVEKQFPGDAVQRAAWLAESARRISGADYGLCYGAARGDTPAFALITDGRNVYVSPVAPDANRMTVSNHLLDLTRRLVSGLDFAAGSITFRLGKAAPELLRPAAGAPTPKAPEAPKKQHREEEPEGAVIERELDRFTLSNLGLDDVSLKPAPAVKPAPRAPEHMPRKVSDTYEFARQVDRRRTIQSRSFGTTSDLRQAAAHIYRQGLDDLDDESELPDLTAHRRRERRKARWTWLWLILALLVLAGGIAAFVLFLRTHNANPVPDAANYGTGAFDTAALAYLTEAREKDPTVSAYLALPGQAGALVHSAAAEQQSEDTWAWFAPQAQPGEPLANCIVYCDDPALANLARMDELENVQKNSGFTLYQGESETVLKVASVFEWNPSQPDDFDPTTCTSLVNYLDYTEFAVNILKHSLYDFPVEISDVDSYATLLCPREDGSYLVVVGRQVRAGEDAALVPSAIAPAGSGQPREVVLKHNAGAAQANDDSAAPAADGVSVSDTVAALNEQTQALLASTDAMLAGLTDLAGESGASAVETDLNQGAEGSLPNTTVTVDSVLSPATETPAETEASTEEPEETPDPAEEDTAEEETPEPQKTPKPTDPPKTDSSTEGQTINVTMNGSAQTMDLVECLAMIAQNELGNNQPAEAYKAQAVAAHCWILSQGGYPSVLGASPSGTVRAAVAEVANVLITYNGSVCFTPYFASASTGTCSSADVWGGSRAYLQAVDSPYDETYATSWNTNGSTSGSARFARESVQSRVQDKLGIDLGDLDPSEWFTPLSTNSYGWVTQLQIGQGSNSTTCSGRWFRETLLARASVDGRSLRSNAFTFEFDEGLDCFVFDVYGYGHGCGLSQWGAIGYADNGWSYDQILTHYFTGVTLTTY